MCRASEKAILSNKAIDMMRQQETEIATLTARLEAAEKERHEAVRLCRDAVNGISIEEELRAFLAKAQQRQGGEGKKS